MLKIKLVFFLTLTKLEKNNYLFHKSSINVIEIILLYKSSNMKNSSILQIIKSSGN